MYFKKILIFLLLAGMSCKKETAVDSTVPEGFEATPVSKPLIPGTLDEASGIADSKTNPGYVWVQEDGGNPNDIALLSHDGVLLKKFIIKSAVNHDWEDIALANGPIAGTNYIYVADIGDNNLAFSQHALYRFAEPGTAAKEVSDYDQITFQYPDGAHDAEAILVDNTTKDIYIITKRDASSKIYKLPYPQSTAAINTAVLSGSLTFSGVTSAAFSSDNKEILIRTYEKIYYWKKKKEQSIEQTLAETPVVLSYQLEPQGEAICFKNDNSGFFTLSERPSIIAAINLNFYKRK